MIHQQQHCLKKSRLGKNAAKKLIEIISQCDQMSVLNLEGNIRSQINVQFHPLLQTWLNYYSSQFWWTCLLLNQLISTLCRYHLNIWSLIMLTITKTEAVYQRKSRNIRKTRKFYWERK